MPNKNRNICIIASSLGQGGAEKVAALQSQMLENLGYNVFVVSLLNHIEYEYSGTLLNLGGLKDINDGFFDRLHRFKIFKQFLKKHQIDLIIDHRSRNSLLRELILNFLVYKNIKTIFVIHSHNLLKSFPKNKIITKFLYSKKTTLVSVSKEIQEKIKSSYGLNNVINIYNSFQLKTKHIPVEIPDEEYILFFGRLDEEAKDLTFLIQAYHKSILPSKGIKLYLLGNGQDKSNLIALVKKLRLTNYVIFKNATKNPFPIVQKAKFTVLTSHFEGFPLSIVESLACKTPVVSVDCESGPKEIITNNFNGLLVKKDLNIYTQALNKMILDSELLSFCKQNCIKSIEHLSFVKIQEEWSIQIEKIFNKESL